MKTFFRNSWVLALLFALPFMSCSSDDSPSPNAQLITQVQSQIVTGSWRVTLFNEDGVNKTSQFEGFDFIFTANGSVTATKNSDLVTGTWVTGIDDSTPKFVLLFTVNSGPFEEISEDWRIMTVTSSQIELRHVSGGDGSIDLLTFTKN
ncbi:MAG: hypothetical protein ACK4FS_03055 [Flavobacterium sp.]